MGGTVKQKKNGAAASGAKRAPAKNGKRAPANSGNRAPASGGNKTSASGGNRVSGNRASPSGGNRAPASGGNRAPGNRASPSGGNRASPSGGKRPQARGRGAGTAAAGNGAVNTSNIKPGLNNSLAENAKKTARVEIKGIVIVLIGALMMAAFFVENSVGRFGDTFKAVTCGLLGLPGYFVPTAVIIAGIMIILARSGKILSLSTVYLILLFVILSALIHAFYYNRDTYMNFDSALVMVKFYADGMELRGGGLLGGMIALPIISVFQVFGAKLILSALLLIDIILLTNVSIAAFLKALGKTASKGALRIYDLSKRKKGDNEALSGEHNEYDGHNEYDEYDEYGEYDEYSGLSGAEGEVGSDGAKGYTDKEDTEGSENIRVKGDRKVKDAGGTEGTDSVDGMGGTEGIDGTDGVEDKEGIVGRPGVGIAGKPGTGIAGRPGVGIAGRPGVGIAGKPGAGKAYDAIAGNGLGDDRVEGSFDNATAMAAAVNGGFGEGLYDDLDDEDYGYGEEGRNDSLDVDGRDADGWYDDSWDDDDWYDGGWDGDDWYDDDEIDIDAYRSGSGGRTSGRAGSGFGRGLPGAGIDYGFHGRTGKYQIADLAGASGAFGFEDDDGPGFVIKKRPGTAGWQDSLDPANRANRANRADWVNRANRADWAANQGVPSSYDGSLNSEGFVGNDGFVGSDGLTNSDGLTDSDGLTGYDGAEGLDGVEGLDEDRGFEGTEGIDSAIGLDGADGMYGGNGQDGTGDSVDGVYGTNGQGGAGGSADGMYGANGQGGAGGSADGMYGANGQGNAGGSADGMYGANGQGDAGGSVDSVYGTNRQGNAGGRAEAVGQGARLDRGSSYAARSYGRRSAPNPRIGSGPVGMGAEVHGGVAKGVGGSQANIGGGAGRVQGHGQGYGRVQGNGQGHGRGQGTGRVQGRVQGCEGLGTRMGAGTGAGTGVGMGAGAGMGAGTAFKFPATNLLQENSDANARNVQKMRIQAQKTAALLEETLRSFKVSATVVDFSMGPSVTRYDLQPDTGVKVNTIINLAEDISLKLATSGVRIAPVAGRSAVGIEVPNKEVSKVTLREIVESEQFLNSKSRLAFAIGKDISGETVVADIASMPHMLVAGATGSGKSVCLNCMIISLMYKASPEELKMIMIDPKVVELGVYNGIPHLMIPVVTEPRKAAGALAWAVQEMLNRYKVFSEKKVKDLGGYNSYMRKRRGGERMPRLVIIIDELADLMMAAPKDVEDSICRLAQMGRAAGIHLVIATQRPSVDVITGVIKANIPSRIAFSVASQIDSRTILDMAGAEKLLGKGDMLFYPVGEKKPLRMQGAYVSEAEVERVVSYIKKNQLTEYDEDVIETITSAGSQVSEESNGGDNDELLPRAVELVVDAGQASVSMVQRRFKVGYARAARIIDQMETRGIVSGFDGSKPRQVLISKQQFYEMKL